MSKMVEHVDEISAKIQADAKEDDSRLAEDSHWSDKTLTETIDNDLLNIGRLIKDRLKALIEEFEEKVEECTMRVDGMAMATQWVKIIFFRINIALSLLTAYSPTATRTWISHRLPGAIPVK